MNPPDTPPSYEDNRTEVTRQSYQFSVEEPDFIYAGRCFVVVDFIPWHNNNCEEDFGYILLRANHWLSKYPRFKVIKCEVIPRMADSRGTLDLTNSYIFQFSSGRQYFYNQLRLHCFVEQLKTQSDQIALKTYIPTMIRVSGFVRFNSRIDYSWNMEFDDVPSLITRINYDIGVEEINGSIINISSFYFNVAPYVPELLSDQSLIRDQTLFYEDAAQGRCHVKCLRVFFKPGTKIDKSIGITTFIGKDVRTSSMDELITNVHDWFLQNSNKSFISMETVPVFHEDTTDNLNSYHLKLNSTFFKCHMSAKIIRIETVNGFYFDERLESLTSDLLPERRFVSNVWITPRKHRDIYETYNSYMDYVNCIINYFENSIIDIETHLIPNSIVWATVRHQSLLRYESPNASNYKIYAIRLLLNGTNDKNVHDVVNVPLPYISPSKFSYHCCAV